MCSISHRNAWIDVGDSEGDLRMHYVEAVQNNEKPRTKDLPVILLIHGFPQTSYQYRYVMQPLALQRFRVLAPDYRGAGHSARPRSGYDKVTMATDLLKLAEHLDLPLPLHIVGHDIGAMIAHAFATEYPQATASLIFGECPLPGSSFYNACRFDVAKFHFLFHCVPDGLPEALVAGREDLYLGQFFDRLAVETRNLQPDTIKHYVEAYAQPGAMRAAMDVYRAFATDAKHNIERRQVNGKCSSVPTLVLSGALSSHASEAQAMANEFYSKPQVAVVESSGHYVAEENPQDFVTKVVAFIRSVQKSS